MVAYVATRTHTTEPQAMIAGYVAVVATFALVMRVLVGV